MLEYQIFFIVMIACLIPTVHANVLYCSIRSGQRAMLTAQTTDGRMHASPSPRLRMDNTRAGGRAKTHAGRRDRRHPHTLTAQPSHTPQHPAQLTRRSSARDAEWENTRDARDARRYTSSQSVMRACICACVMSVVCTCS